MFLLSTAAIVTVVSGAAASGSHEIPISYSEAGAPQTVVSVLFHDDIVGKLFTLTMGDASLFEVGVGRSSLRGTTHALIQFPNTRGPIVFKYSDPNIILHQAGAGWYLGVGPESELVRLHESVTILRGFDSEKSERLDKLVVNLDLDEFIGNCESSLVQLENTQNWAIPGTAASKATLELRPVEERVPLPVDFGSTQVSFQAFEKVRLSRTLADRIGSYITDLGGVAGSDIDSFTNCEWDIVSRLPFIRIIFTDSAGDLVPLSFGPDDYMKVDEVSRTCQLVAFSDDRDMLAVNPLLFPEMNVRITKSRVEVCKSSL